MLRSLAMLRKMSTTGTTIARHLKLVTEKIEAAAAKRPVELQYVTPRLVAVSKTKSASMIIEAYDAGQKHFGENYVVELHEKANDIELQDRCEDIKWHFIGHLQRNKVAKVLDVPNLYVIETVDSERLAKAINDSWQKLNKTDPLKVMAQINTSEEENKSGCAPKDALQMVQYIRQECTSLRLIGLMTIGSFNYDPNSGPNPDFQALFKIRSEVCTALNIPIKDLELSMGMSADYEHAIELGSTNVRVGSTIFGSRNTSHSESQTISESDDKSNDKESSYKITASDTLPKDIQNLALN